MTVEVKICGLDRPETVDGAVNAGAEMLGFVFYPPSPRNLTASAASRLTNRVPAGVKRVGLFVDPTDEMITTVLNQNLPNTIVYLVRTCMIAWKRTSGTCCRD